MKKIELRDDMTIRVFTINEKPSKTDQQWEEECNVNNILAKWANGTSPAFLSKTQGQYLDISEYGSFQDAANIVSSANSAFSAMHPLIRERFNQDPAQLIAFLSDSKNSEEAQQLGLIPIQTPKAQPAEDKRERVQDSTTTPLKTDKKSDG